MLKRLLAILGFSVVTNGAVAANAFHEPYQEETVNFLYNLLFCDDISLIKKDENNKDTFWNNLLADDPDKAQLLDIAENSQNEGRVRAIAYNRLRAMGQEVPAKVLLGVIVEVPLEQGLDVLAAFSDGSVRYLNQAGKIAIFESGARSVDNLAKELIERSKPVVNQIGAWDKARLPPPSAGNVRMTFLVSDGLYFGEGPFDALMQDGMASPVLSKASELLQRVVELGVE